MYSGNTLKIKVGNICEGCMSTGRRSSPIPDNETQVLFSDILKDLEHLASVILLCWECKHILHMALEFRNKLRKSKSLLHQDVVNSSLSPLSTMKTEHVVEVPTHVDEQLLVVKIEKDEPQDFDQSVGDQVDLKLCELRETSSTPKISKTGSGRKEIDRDSNNEEPLKKKNKKTDPKIGQRKIPGPSSKSPTEVIKPDVNKTCDMVNKDPMTEELLAVLTEDDRDSEVEEMEILEEQMSGYEIEDEDTTYGPLSLSPSKIEGGHYVGVGGVLTTVRNIYDDIANDSDSEPDGDHRLQNISSVTSRTGSPVLETDDTAVSSEGATTGMQQKLRNRGLYRGRPQRRIFRGRGSRSRISRSNAAANGNTPSSVWSPENQLLERYSDDQLSQSIREEKNVIREVKEREMRTTTDCLIADQIATDADIDFDQEPYVWSQMDDWNGTKEKFLVECPGPTSKFETAYQAFRAFWDDSLLSHIVTETNRYANEIRSERFKQDWYETNTHEILLLFAFWMMLGIIKMPTIKSCFTSLPILRTGVFRTMFSENRYWNLNKAFHLQGNRLTKDPSDILQPMGPVLDSLNVKFKQNYALEQDICIDESLTLWTGPISSKSFGIKMFNLCESKSGYLWTCSIGRQTKSTLPENIATVVKLVEPLLNKGHVLYMDNRFSCPQLGRYLKLRHTDCVGTLRYSSRDVPAVIHNATLSKGEFVARHCGDVMVVAIRDKKRVHCMSTFHDLTEVQKPNKSGPPHHRLQLIDDYNHGMAGVLRMDQTLEPYLVERKQCAKWSKKLFKRLLNITIQNARILLEKSTNTKIPALNFRLVLVQAILDHHSRVASKPAEITSAQRPHRNPYRNDFPLKGLEERHFVRRIPITDEMRATIKHPNNLGRRQCRLCIGNANGRRSSIRRTVYECEYCEVPLCLEPCFKIFHTVP